jgi:tripartite-type tricarboxylate transporter receptor subunit TctC
MKVHAALLIVLFCLGLAAPARAWPERPVQLIVPFPPGGLLDIAARGLATVLTDRLGVAVAVVARDGAAGAIGARSVATARPDGYTLAWMPSPPVTVQPQLVRNPGYGLASFRPICQLFHGYFGLLGAADGPREARAAIAAAVANPGAISLGYGGNGTHAHWALLNLQQAAGVQFNAIPFRGDPPMVTALLAGDIRLAALGLGSVIANRERVPVLMMFTAARLPELPDVPTASELGWPVVEQQFGGLFAPAGLPDAIAARLEAECERATSDPRFLEPLRTARFALAHRGAVAFTAALEADVAAKRGLIVAAGLLPE